VYFIVLQGSITFIPTTGGKIEYQPEGLTKPVDKIVLQAKGISENNTPSFTELTVEYCQKPTTTQMTTVLTTTKQTPEQTEKQTEKITIATTISAAGTTTKEASVVTTTTAPVATVTAGNYLLSINLTSMDNFSQQTVIKFHQPINKM